MSNVKHIDINPQLLTTKRTRKSRAKTGTTAPRIRVKSTKSTTIEQSDKKSDSMVVQKREQANAPGSSTTETKTESDEFSAAIQYLNELSKQKNQKRLGVRPPSFTRTNTTHNSRSGRINDTATPRFKLPPILPARSTMHLEQPIRAPSLEPTKIKLTPRASPSSFVPSPSSPTPPTPPTPSVHLPIKSDNIPLDNHTPIPAYKVDGAIPYSSLVNGIKPSYRKYTQKIRPAPRICLPPQPRESSTVDAYPAKTIESGNNAFNIRRIRKTLRRKYHVGKSDKHHKVSVLVKNVDTQKRNRDAHESLRNVNMTDIRSYLLNHNLIRADSVAPDHVLKQLFESAMLTGDVNNTNSGVVVHNALANTGLVDKDMNVRDELDHL